MRTIGRATFLNLPAVLIFSFLFLLMSVSVTRAVVVINEFSSAAGTSDDSDWPDWVEIYHDSEELTNYQIIDDSDNVKNLSEATCTGNFCTIDWSNRLGNSGDTIKLILISDPDNPIDSITYGGAGNVCPPDHGQTVGRIVVTEGSDPGNTIERLAAATKGTSNYGVTLAPCPSPTSIPQPTNTPTATPQPTNTPTPTATPTPKPTSTPMPTAKPTKVLTMAKPTEEIKLDLKESEPSEIVDSNGVGSASVMGYESDSGKTDFVPIILIGSGAGVLGLSAFAYVAQKKKWSIKDIRKIFSRN
ncbi:MAG TPA: hypothetical protein VI819_02130 [Patescibacteria group bacterium]|nr:hypothetical protein [Patescibacteria group bacterium]